MVGFAEICLATWYRNRKTDDLELLAEKDGKFYRLYTVSRIIWDRDDGYKALDRAHAEIVKRFRLMGEDSSGF